jgi:pyruvate dehydrogenase E2 component (dihydrolipoamide acetyltransferase)
MYEVKLPKMGQSVEEASIVTWFKKEGDPVTAGDPLFSIQTDKAEVECEAPAGGILRKILLAPDVVVPVLTIVALIGDADEPLPDGAGTTPTPAPAETRAEISAVAGVPPVAAAAPQVRGDGGRVFISPRARAQATSKGIHLSGITGSGPQERILEADVLAQAEGLESLRITPTARRLALATGVDLTTLKGSGLGGKITRADVAAAASKPVETLPPSAAGIQRIPLTPMRRIIAKRMAESKFSAPHYYITVEVDMAAAKEFRTKAQGGAPSFNDLVLCATVKALRDFPGINARWAGDTIEQVGNINLGVAVALPGGLIVPVLKQAQTLTLEEICAACKTLIEKARTGKLLPDDFTGNTFTVSNLGPFGVDHFTAIINQPDSAILAIGQIKDRPVVINGGIHIRPIMKLTLSSDHRVIDGVLAAQFMARLKEILETADL